MLLMEEILTPLGELIQILYFVALSIFIPMLQDFKRTALTSSVVSSPSLFCFEEKTHQSTEHFLKKVSSVFGES